MNPLPREEQRQARRARELVEAAGGLEACAEETGLSTSHLSRYGSTAEKDSMPLRVIERLESVTHGMPGHPVVTTYLAARQGFTLVKRPQVPSDRAALMELLSQHASARGECEKQILHALADGRVDAGEASALVPLFRASFELTNQMLAELEAIAGDGQ